MAFEHILYDVDERIATITLNRPDVLNAWTRQMDEDVRQAMSDATADDDVRVVVLTGAGRGFCAGADMALLNDTIEASGGAAERAQASARQSALVRGPVPGGIDPGPDFHLRYTYFPTVPKPVIAAINGPCAGLGLIMALYCDLRFAADGAVFTTAFSRRGLIAEHGVDWILPQLVGLPNALDLLLSGRRFDADEARRLGMVNRVVAPDDLIADVRAYAAELATMVSPRSMRVMKEQLYRTRNQSLGQAIGFAVKEMALSFQSEDFKEGVAHYVEKRSPAFTGR